MGRFLGVVIVLLIVAGGIFGYKDYKAAGQFRQNLTVAGYTNIKPDGPLGYVTDKAVTSTFHGCTLRFANAPKGTKPRSINGTTVPAYGISAQINGKLTPQGSTLTAQELGRSMKARKVHCDKL